jgi:hypothetical protein
MSFVVLIAVAAALAYLVGKAWAMAIPPAIGFFTAGAVIGLGAQINDTPLPVAVVVATVAAAFGIVARRQQTGRYSSAESR